MAFEHNQPSKNRTERLDNFGADKRAVIQIKTILE